MLLPAVTALVAAAAVPALAGVPDYEHVITRDVAIIGGGGSGAYAAVQLKDKGYSVVVVEKEDHLGGHAETKYVPGGHIDYGVVAYFNDSVTTKFLNRLGVGYQNFAGTFARNQVVDFKTGKKLPNPTGELNITQAIKVYYQAISNYTYTLNGTFNLPDPVPEELLRPFGEFVEKHKLQGALDLIFTFASGVGNLLEKPLIYVLQDVGLVHVKALMAGLIAPDNGVADVFAKITGVLGPQNVLYNTVVDKAERCNADGGVTLVVKGGKHGRRSLIKAKKLLVSIPPTLKNMHPFALDTSEHSLFQKWNWQNYYVAVIANSGIPNNTLVTNLDPSQPSSLPVPPFQWRLEYYNIPNYVTSKVIGDANMTAADAKRLIFGDFARMNGTYPIRNPEIVAFADHSPLTLGAPVDDVRDGFYQELYGLQGLKNTFYTGLAFASDYSSVLWAYTDSIVEQMFPAGEKGGSYE